MSKVNNEHNVCLAIRHWLRMLIAASMASRCCQCSTLISKCARSARRKMEILLAAICTGLSCYRGPSIGSNPCTGLVRLLLRHVMHSGSPQSSLSGFTKQRLTLLLICWQALAQLTEDTVK